MSAPSVTFAIPEATRIAQAQASDPEASAWVSANAGSGKTHVLAARVLRLLLAGHDPSKILCLTYTRAAAAEMANRVFANLSRWTIMDDRALSDAIAELEGSAPRDGKIVQARRLFARALDTPGGLKIQTIHAFCEAILHRFPLEADIPGHFELMDDTMESALASEAMVAMLQAVHSADSEGGVLGEAFSAVLEAGGEHGLASLLEAVLSNREPVARFIEEAETAGGVEAVLRHAFGLVDATKESLCQELTATLSAAHVNYFHLAAQLTRHGAENAKKLGAHLAALANDSDPVSVFESLRTSNLFKADGEPASVDRIAVKAVREAEPDAAETLLLIQKEVTATRENLADLQLAGLTAQAMVLAWDVTQRYAAAKRRLGRLDYDDLINRTADLLQRADASAWVHYKLDRGIDHILVDEAQDTNPRQWEIIRLLAEEFFAGKGADRTEPRTLFAVGDEKQSIYSFQGARPQAFGEVGRWTGDRSGAAGQTFMAPRLELSFRSTEAVLNAVDRVFEPSENHRGMAQPGHGPVHETRRRGEPGSVEVWDMVQRTQSEPPEEWYLPLDRHGASDPLVITAERIADRIAEWLTSPKILAATGRRVSPGDILVLVRKRSDGFSGVLARSLKAKRIDGRPIPVAGTDQLKLTDHIAVRDLMALGRIALLPEDDLALAGLLRSPLFDLPEDMLMDLAMNRKQDESLFQALRQRRSDPVFAACARRLADWTRLADFAPVFEFYADILGPGGARRMLRARLGEDCDDVIDEFLAYALSSEETGPPGLEIFLAGLENQSPIIKRQMDRGRGEVRIMTVHAAKGLEAPIVFLVDSGGAPSAPAHRPVLVPFLPDADWPEGKPGFLWRSAGLKSRHLTALDQTHEQAADDEYRRLLYVAMTRAEDLLVICGYYQNKVGKHRHWHKIVLEALEEEGVWHDHPQGWRSLLFGPRQDGRKPGPGAGENKTEADTGPARHSDIVLTEARVEPALPRPLAPSGASSFIEDFGSADGPAGSPVLGPATQSSPALERGTVIHRLLQTLPTRPVPHRRQEAMQYLDHRVPHWPKARMEEVVEQIMAILENPHFALLFGENSRAEIAVAGTVNVAGSERAISGQIDRVAVSADDVMVVDYKTNQSAPQVWQEVPQSHLVQMALYRALLQPLYPGRTVKAGLLYTARPILIVLPGSILTTSLDEFAATLSSP